MSSFQPRRNFFKTCAGLSAASALPAALNIHVRAAGSDLPFSTGNDRINTARDAALAVLKPTPAELEKGLRLHAEALVFESYGFAPRCAMDGEAYGRAIAEGTSAEELADMREEMSMTRAAYSEAERTEFLEAFRASGVTCVFQNAGEEGNDPLRLMKRLARFTHLTDLMQPDLFKAVVPDDIVKAKAEGRLCLYLTGNGVPLRQQWVSTRDELRMIRLFHQMGIRMMHLTYNRRNPIGDGCGEANDGGLSDFGHEVVKEMNRIGVIVDVAHSGWRTSLEGAKASEKPMVASHTTCAALHKDIRSKPDEVIKAICDTGGLIGICFISRFLGGSGDISAFLDHIDYAVKTFGADHVAIGPDVAYASRNDQAERAKMIEAAGSKEAPRGSSSRWEHLWPPSFYQPPAAAAQTLAWTNWPLFTVGMVQRGHSEETIRKILGENVLRVARANFTGGA